MAGLAAAAAVAGEEAGGGGHVAGLQNGGAGSYQRVARLAPSPEELSRGPTCPANCSPVVKAQARELAMAPSAPFVPVLLAEMSLERGGERAWRSVERTGGGLPI